MSPYEAVYFDLDSTICEPIRDRAELLETAFDRAGVEQFCTVAGLRIAGREVTDADTDRAYFEALFEAAAERFDGDPASAPALADAYLSTIDPARVRFRPGAEEALSLASEAGPVGLITNGGPETQSKKLAALGIEDAFDVSVFVDPRNGIPPKPDPKPFELALSALGLSPEETIHVGDNPYADVGGAEAVGMDSAWINLGHGSPPDREPTYELRSLAEFDRVVG